VPQPKTESEAAAHGDVLIHFGETSFRADIDHPATHGHPLDPYLTKQAVWHPIGSAAFPDIRKGSVLSFLYHGGRATSQMTLVEHLPTEGHRRNGEEAIQWGPPNFWGEYRLTFQYQ
jgi:hypothetical protein